MTRLLADPNNPCNNWQDNLRSGYLDMPLIRYALKVNGPVDSLALTHLDKVGNPWKVAYSYDRNILQAGKTGPVKLGKDLASVRYLTTRVKKKRFVSWLELTLETPVGITSEGPLFRDKKFHGAFAMA
jgi:adenylosuccinate synthase